MKNRMIFFLLFTILLISGCSDSTSEPIIEDPLEARVGTTWVYEQNLSSHYSDRYLPSYTVRSINVEDSIKIYRLDQSGEFAVYWDDDGFHEEITPADSLGQVDGGWAFWTYKYPVGTGDTWEEFADPGPFWTTCLDNNVSVSVPYGIIDGCVLYKIDMEWDNLFEFVWMKPSIGIVKRHMAESLDSDGRTMELVSFTY